MSAPGRCVVGVDIGGANLKFAAPDGRTHTLPFSMWKMHRQLSEYLRIGLAHFEVDARTCLAVTMTGELADCFATRRQGVLQILQQVGQVCAAEQTFVYTLAGEWCSPAQVALQPLSAAASNWHALSNWLASSTIIPHRNLRLVVDIGSTTVDVIPILQRQVATPAHTDRQRMERGQLVYTGCERTPIAAIVRSVVVDAKPCPLMAERFADSLDAYLVLSLADEDPENLDTADGRPRTRQCAVARLARMVGEDSESLCVEAIERIATQVVQAQVESIVEAILGNLPLDEQAFDIAFCGHGQALSARVQRKLSVVLATRGAVLHRLEDYLSAAASRCAPAVAVACLLERHLASCPK